MRPIFHYDDNVRRPRLCCVNSKRKNLHFRMLKYTYLSKKSKFKAGLLDLHIVRGI